MLTVGEMITGTSIDLDYQGQGVVRHEGYVLFVKGLLQGETAKIKIDKIKKNFGEGTVEKLIERSSDRTDHLLIYGSTDLIHLHPEAQKTWQIKTTEETIRKIAGIDQKVNHIIEHPQTMYYRNKSVFHMMDAETLTLGLYAYGSQMLIPIKHFILADDVTNAIVKRLSGLDIFVDHLALRHLMIRTNPKGEALVTLVSTTPKFYGLDPLIACLKDMPSVIGITLNIKDHPMHILGDKSLLIYGENGITEPIDQTEIKISDRAFYQVNPFVSPKVYDYIKSKIIQGKRVIDAYSGVGSIGFSLRHVTQHITLIESNEESLAIAEDYIKKEHLNHVDLVHGEAEDVIDQHQADILIVDPPRQGLKSLLIEKVLKQSYIQIFYLSCDVKTLARDLKMLSSHWNIDEVVAIRMFPQTTELETLVMLKPRKV